MASPGCNAACYDVAIVGAGAAGLAAAIFAAEAAEQAGRPLRIALLDGARPIGKKILISGGGRCNVTHDEVSASDFNGNSHVVRNILAAFDSRDTVRWFASLGVELKREETGKLFPTTDRAGTVLDALLARCRALGIELLDGCRVQAVRGCTAARIDGTDQFSVQLDSREVFALAVVLATGGRSLPSTGSDGHGWTIARHLGHTVTTTVPALVPLLLETSMFHSGLSGLSVEVELTVAVGGRHVARHAGSLLWTHFGVSGPVVLDASRHITLGRTRGLEPELACNFLPGQDFAAAERWLIDAGTANPRRLTSTVLADALPQRLARALVAWVEIDAGLPVAQLSREARRRLCHALTALVLPVVKERGWNYAEVTAGGVPLAEVKPASMESRRTPGLYLAGEMLDCDGRIGGFNFQWAWSTGYLAGRGAAAHALAQPRVV